MRDSTVGSIAEEKLRKKSFQSKTFRSGLLAGDRTPQGPVKGEETAPWHGVEAGSARSEPERTAGLVRIRRERFRKELQKADDPNNVASSRRDAP
jgi:hypothetical protein